MELIKILSRILKVMANESNSMLILFFKFENLKGMFPETKNLVQTEE